MKIIHHIEGGYSIYAEEPETSYHYTGDDVGKVKRSYMEFIEKTFDEEMFYCIGKQLKGEKNNE